MTMLEVQDLSFAYDRRRPVLDGVSFAVKQAVNVGLVGESGSGKTTLLRLLLGLARPSGGTIRFEGAKLDPSNGSWMRAYRRSVQTVFQDPYSSLDPRQKVMDIVSEPLRSLRIPGSRPDAVAAVLESVGLTADAMHRYPHEFSGGQRQRIAIARAVVAQPQLLLADEAVSALDLSTRIRIVELFKRLSQGLTLLFVSHDLGVVASLCKEIVILEHGRIVESGRTHGILTMPQHPYTKKLLASVPRMPA